MKTFFVLAILFCSSIATTVIEFDGFTADNIGQLQMNGIAPSLTPNSQAYLTLTNNSGPFFGTAFVNEAISLTSGFSTFFAFSMTNPGPHGGADGIVFVINAQSASVGSTGCGIGYQCIPKSLGIEFDTYLNSEWAKDCANCTGKTAGFYHGAGYNPYGDNDDNHVGVNLNGDPGSVSTSRYPVSFKDGNMHYAWIDYDGTNIYVRVNEVNERPKYAIIEYPINLETLIGSTQGYVGFTSGTGYCSEYHNIAMWSFSSTYSPYGEDQGCVGEIHDDPAIFGYNGQRFLFDGAAASTFNIYNDNHGLLVNGELSSTGTPFGNGSIIQTAGIITPGGHQITVSSDATDDSKATFTFLYDGVSTTINKGQSVSIGNCTTASFDKFSNFVVTTPIHKVYIYDVTKTHVQKIDNTFLNVHVNFIPQINMQVGGLLGQTVSNTATMNIGASSYATTGLFTSDCTACTSYSSTNYDACNNEVYPSLKRSSSSKRDATMGSPSCSIPMLGRSA